MTWSYTPVLRPLDGVRFLIGDKDATDQQMPDEEVIFCLEQQGAPTGGRTATSGVILRAAMDACDGLAAQYGRQITSNLSGALLENAEQKFEHYTALSATLRRRAARRGVGVLFPAYSAAAKAGVEEDSDRVPPFFTRDEMTEPGTGAVEVDPLTGAILSGPTT